MTEKAQRLFYNAEKSMLKVSRLVTDGRTVLRYEIGDDAFDMAIESAPLHALSILQLALRNPALIEDVVEP